MVAKTAIRPVTVRQVNELRDEYAITSIDPSLEPVTSFIKT